MLANRSTRRFVLACLSVLVLTGGMSARAQTATSGEDPFGVGATDGRRLGLRQGRILGRAQALYGSFRDGFRQGLEEAREADRGRGRVEQARLAGRTRGLASGEPSGRDAGAAAALASWLEQGKSRPLPATVAPDAPDVDAPPACAAAQPIGLPLGREVRVVIDPEGLEIRESPVEVDSFDLAYPSRDDLRTRARAAGATAEAVGFWVRDYKFAFQSAWNEAFTDQRSGTPLGERDELESLGLQIGRKEGDRRLACKAGQATWQEGYERAWAESWSSAFMEGWNATDERHGKRAVVVVLDPRLIDASGDGLLEPGEGLRLEARLVNAGAVEARRSAGSWGALRGLESEGHLEGGLAPGQSRDLKLDLGSVDPQAPTGTSVVVRIRGLGSQAQTLNQRLGRPARIEAAKTELATDKGRLVARIEARILSTSPASSRAKLVLAGRGGESEVGRLKDGEAKSVELVLPASLPERIGARVTGVFVLRTSEGQPWHAGRWAASLGVLEATALAATGDAPAELDALLLEHLAAEWDSAMTGDPKAPLPEGLTIHAAGFAGLPRKAQQRLERQVTAPLLEHVDGSSGPKRLKKRVRQLFAS